MDVPAGATRWRLLALWVLANGLSAVISIDLVKAAEAVDAGRLAPTDSRAYTVAAYALAFAYYILPPVLTAVIQWLVLSRAFRRAGWWVVATTLGFIAGIAAINPVFAFVSFRFVGEESGWGIVAGAIVCGMIAGVAQWFVLRRRLIHAYWWVVASTVGWTAAILLILRLTRALEAGFGASLAAALASGALYGVVTGFALVWLLRRPVVRRGFEVTAVAGVGEAERRRGQR